MNSEFLVKPEKKYNLVKVSIQYIKNTLQQDILMQKSSFLSQEDPLFSSLNSFCSSSCPVTVLDPNAPGHSWVDTIKNYTFQTHTFSFSPSLPFSLSLFLSPSLFHSSTLCVLCACMSICT